MDTIIELFKECRHGQKKIFRPYERILYHCGECDLIFVDDTGKGSGKEILYEDYYRKKTGGRFHGFIELFIKMFRFFRAFKIFTIYPEAKSILDIGCGRGFMLYFLKKYFNFSAVVGTQISPNALNFARKQLALNVLDRDLLEVNFGEQKFDIVTLWHVLEHVDEPGKYVEKIFYLLNDKGKLILEVPNMHSWTANFTGRYWLGLDLKYHRYFFSPASLARLLESRGFVIKKIHTFSLEYSFFISAQSIVSFLTHSNHLIFEWLQTGKFRLVLFFQIILFALLFPFSCLVNLLLFFSNRGEVLLMIAEKPAEAAAYPLGKEQDV